MANEQELDPMRHSCVLPEGCIPSAVIEVVEYIDEDGDAAYAFRFPPHLSYTAALGLLELVKAQILHRYFDDD